MPYKNEDYSFGVILPKDYKRLDSLNNLGDMIDYIEDGVDVEVWLPKFTHRKKISITKALTDLGCKSMFSPYIADFSNLAKDLFVSEIAHEAVVIVDEEGTEAAAATVAYLHENFISLQEKPTVEFKADHPFVYYIRNKITNKLLFVGECLGE